MKTQTQRIIECFGADRRAMERMTRYTYAKIRLWDNNGFVPSDEHQNIIDDAAAAGIEIPPSRFIEHLERRPIAQTKPAA